MVRNYVYRMSAKEWSISGDDDNVPAPAIDYPVAPGFIIDGGGLSG